MVSHLTARRVVGVLMETVVGSVTLPGPVMTASGTAGYGDELAPFMDLSQLGAVVTKSLAPYEWAGNPAPRVHPTAQGMMNAVGLQGPGVEYWLANVLPTLLATGATVVASIWGRSVEEYRRAAEMLAVAPAGVVAVEVNLSCPNLEGRGSIFAHDVELSAEVIAATEACGRPRWAKLSANTDRIIDVAGAVHGAGAEAVTCINTLLGLAYEPETLRPVLGAGGGGLSGRAIHPVAVRAVHDVHAALPGLPIIGVGGVASGWDAVEMLLAGASAVQVGTATFADPHAPADVQRELGNWAAERGIARVCDVTALT
ncbi:dihydroorotate dehydrogenase [Ilumatobacter nonamiensis]|uniref:dihydroorotate dehydrogenase n=1 Tax=Ilumatobacter nonamiensis TaxID=467093 RepID=UPI001F4C7F20|nr:dihydroorotate dehydrogenase [Ilumatobacter nonamiensis]